MVVFKQISDIKKDGTKYTQIDHVYYVRYIATRDGAVFAEDMEHGLFGKYAEHEIGDISNLDEAANYVGEMFAQGKDVYRCAISLTEEEAAKLGYLERDKWVELLNTTMFDIADEYNVKYENVEYVGSVHMEKGHPHLQFNFWDKNQTIQNKILPKPKFERRMEHVRAILSKEIYKDSIHEILQEKEVAEKSTLTGFNAFLRGISQQELSAAELNLKGIFSELCDEKMLNIKVDDHYINKVYEGMESVRNAIRAEYPKGALKYKYLPPSCKAALDELSNIVLEHPDFRRELNQYLHHVKEYSTALGNGSKTIAEEQRKALKEMRKRFGNRILNNMKEDIRDKSKGKDGVDIIVKPEARTATVFDSELLRLCNRKGVFHEEDIADNAHLKKRVAVLEQRGYITNYGMRYEVSPEFKGQVEKAIMDFKKNKLWGIDRSFIELKRFTPEDLNAHPKNDNGKLEKRLPLLLATGLVQAEGDGFCVTAEYKSLYNAQMEEYKQSRFQKWFEENIDNDVKISVFDAEFLRLGSGDSFTRENLENSSRFDKLEFRLRRLVAENYIAEVKGSFLIAEKMKSELSEKLKDFKSKLYAADTAFVKMEHFTLEQIRENPANKKKSEDDELGAMEKRLSVLLAAGFVLEQSGEYTITEEYRSACYASSAAYRQKNFDKRAKPQADTVRLNLFDSEFLSIAKGNRFTQAEVERHSESGRLDWRLRALIKDGYITADGINYTLTDTFLRKLQFTQKQFAKNFKISYQDSSFLRLEEKGALTKELLEAQPNSAYLKWRIYGLQFKGLASYDGTAYQLTEEFRNKAVAARELYYKTFSVRLFEKLFEGLGETFSVEAVEAHPMGKLLVGRMDALLHNTYLSETAAGEFSVTQKLRDEVEACTQSFKAVASDGALLKLLEGNALLKSTLEKNFRCEPLTIRLQEYVLSGNVTETEESYRFSKQAIEQINAAVNEDMGKFSLRYFDSNFAAMGESFTVEDIENHAEGLFLIDRLGTLTAHDYLTKNGAVYLVTNTLRENTQELADEVKPTPFDRNLLLLADENNIITQEALSELEKPIRVEYRLQDLICKGYVTHMDEAYQLDDNFVETVAAAYDEFKANFIVQPYDELFAALGANGVFHESDLGELDEFFKKRLSTLLLLEYIETYGDGYIVSEEFKEKTVEAKKNFLVNHFDYSLVQLAGTKHTLTPACVASSVSGDYLQKRFFSLHAMGLISLADGTYTLSDALCKKALLAYEEFSGQFQISSYDLQFLQLTGTAAFTKKELQKDSDSGYLSSRLRSLVQLGLVTSDELDSYRVSDELIAGAQKALEEFELRYSDIRFLRINGTSEFTEDETDFSLARRLRELTQHSSIEPTDSGYRMTDEFRQEAQVVYDKFRKEFPLQPYDNAFVNWSKGGSFQLDALKENPFFESRLYTLSLLEYIRQEGDDYFVSDELREAVIKAKKDFSVNHFDCELVKLAGENKTISLETVLTHRDGAYLQKRFYSLLEMGHITEAGGVFTLTDSFCANAERVFNEFKGSFQISSYDLRFFQLTSSTAFSADDLQNDKDCDYLANRLRTLIQLGFIASEEQDSYRMTEKLIAGAQKASLEFDVTHSDIRFLRINGTAEFTEDETDFSLARRLRELTQHGCIEPTDEGYRMTDEFMKNAQDTYDRFREDFSVQPYDDYFVAWAKGGSFQLDDLNENSFLEGRLYTLLLLQHVRQDGESYTVTEELKSAVAEAKESFSVNHFDIELAKLADAQGNLTVSRVQNDVNGDYLEKRMYSLIATGYITQQGNRLHLSQLFINLAKTSAHEYWETFKVSCYDAEFLKIGTAAGFSIKELKNHEDSGYLESRLRSLMQIGLIRFDGSTYHIDSRLRTAAGAAYSALLVKGTDNRFLQINGANTFTQKEADHHYELGSRLRELCMAGWITKNGGSYTVSEQVVKQIRFQLDLFADTKIGTWDKPFLELQRKLGGFTVEDLKAAFPDRYEALSGRLEYLHFNDLFEKVGKQYFMKQALVNGIDRAEKVQQGIRRQAAVLLLLDIFKMFSKMNNQKEAKQSQPHQDLSKEAKKDIIAEQANSSGTHWEEYER